MGMSMAYKDLSSPVTDEDSIATIHKALELGVTFLDTSDVYGPFTNEELVGAVLSLQATLYFTWLVLRASRHYRPGKAIKGNREKYVVATKFGNKLQPNGPMVVDGSAKYVHEACEASLKRLQIDYIDLYYQHRIDRKVGIETTVTEMKVLHTAPLRPSCVPACWPCIMSPALCSPCVCTHSISLVQTCTK